MRGQCDYSPSTPSTERSLEAEHGLLQLNDSYYVEFDTLNRKLKEISHGTHQWMAASVPGIFMAPGQQPRSCALAGYSNPDGTSLRNHLCYLFRAVALAGNSDGDPKLLVQLEPGWMPALSRGLYCDAGKIMVDPMETSFACGCL